MSYLYMSYITDVSTPIDNIVCPFIQCQFIMIAFDTCLYIHLIQFTLYMYCIWHRHKHCHHIRNVLKNPHVLWVDNFSKVFRKSIPTSSDGTYNSCLWTGYAAFVAADTRVQMTLMHSPSGQTIPGMPQDICSPSCVRQVKAGIEYVFTGIRNHYDRSLVLEYDVRNIPPKIDTKRHIHMKDVVEHKKNSTHNVHPLKLFKRNIGSNDGLVAVLADVCKTYGMVDGSCSEYVILNVDENIYWRVLKVNVIHTSYHNLYVRSCPIPLLCKCRYICCVCFIYACLCVCYRLCMIHPTVGLYFVSSHPSAWRGGIHTNGRQSCCLKCSLLTFLPRTIITCSPHKISM